jgi:hypothetical protein
MLRFSAAQLVVTTQTLRHDVAVSVFLLLYQWNKQIEHLQLVAFTQALRDDVAIFAENCRPALVGQLH